MVYVFPKKVSQDFLVELFWSTLEHPHRDYFIPTCLCYHTLYSITNTILKYQQFIRARTSKPLAILPRPSKSRYLSLTILRPWHILSNSLEQGIVVHWRSKISLQTCNPNQTSLHIDSLLLTWLGLSHLCNPDSPV